ncbi:uncharacterized protein V1516DRAFT_708390 [Lipomyces oligophaga]|uniref:uncharacterized protein n=1 Tax=Lipomyces oligophaga TaxID=45792 RepID=UPI0034CD05C5
MTLSGGTRRTFSPGVYCPLITPFNEVTGDVDLEAFKTQIVRLAKAGIGLVLHGTNGEAGHLSNEERIIMVEAAREALDDNDLNDVPLLVGTGLGSARETIALTKLVAKAGADAVIVIPPGYFAFAIGKDSNAIKDFFFQIFEASPVPVMIYNFPAAAAGIDLNSDLLIELSEHPNNFGVKLTCAGIGKGHRVAQYTASESYIARHPFKQQYLVLPGFSDYLFSAMAAKQNGCITGTGNVFPKLIVALFKAATEFFKNPTAEGYAKVTELQSIVTEADWIIVKVGISGTKYALNQYIQPKLGGVTRTPLPPVTEESKRMVDECLAEAFSIEKSL